MSFSSSQIVLYFVIYYKIFSMRYDPVKVEIRNRYTYCTNGAVNFGGVFLIIQANIWSWSSYKSNDIPIRSWLILFYRSSGVSSTKNSSKRLKWNQLMEALLTLDTIVPCPMSWFIQLVVMFHIGEFMATALFSSATLRQSSFLLNHSRDGDFDCRLLNGYHLVL